MKGKRILSGLLTAVMLLGVLPAASAAGAPEVSLSSGSVEAGQSVTLTVTIKDNPGLAACMLYFYYDTSVFTVDPDKDIRAAGEFRETGGLISNTIAQAKQSSRYDGADTKDGVLSLWYNGSGVDTNSDGKMLTITFRADAEAKAGVYAVELDYSTRETCAEQGDKVALTAVSGTVTVTGGSGTVAGPETPEPETPVQPEKPAASAFGDTAGTWAEEYIRKAAELGLINGYPNGNFGVEDKMTRAQFVTILWRAAGEPQPKSEASFSDLTQDWYKKAVAWAEENKIVNGYPDGRFGVDDYVARDQLAAILHRMAGEPVGMESLFTSTYDEKFADSGQISGWAKPAVYWTVYKGIYCGEASVSVGTKLAPQAEATRSQIAVMIVRYLEKQ